MSFQSFLGQVIDSTGVHPESRKVSAIKNVPTPQTVGEVRRFLGGIIGMVNQLSKFIPNLAERTKPMRELLHKNRQWTWEEPQQEAFDAVKASLLCTPALALHNSNAKTIVSADASSFGLGAVLLHEQKNGDVKPIAYIS